MEVESAHALRALKLEGIGFIPESQRFYPKGSLASHVLGFVGVDNQPLEGIELKYDDRLKGSERKIFVTRDAAGRTLSKGMDIEPLGNNVILTIKLKHAKETERGHYRLCPLFAGLSLNKVLLLF